MRVEEPIKLIVSPTQPCKKQKQHIELQNKYSTKL